MLFPLLIFPVIAAVVAFLALAVLPAHQATCKTLAIALLAVALGASAALVLENVQESCWLFLLNFLPGFGSRLNGFLQVSTVTALAAIAGLPVSKAFAVHFQAL